MASAARGATWRTLRRKGAPGHGADMATLKTAVVVILILVAVKLVAKAVPALSGLASLL